MNAREQGREVSVAIVNAPDPVVLLAAAMSFNENIDELTMAAALHKSCTGRHSTSLRLPTAFTSLPMLNMYGGVASPSKTTMRDPTLILPAPLMMSVKNRSLPSTACPIETTPFSTH